MRKTPTIQDVAGALGMHKSTVSLALSGKGNISAGTRERVLQVARELGYEPNPLAQRLANGQSNSLVCIFSGVLDVGLATEKILLIQRALNARSLEVPIYTCSEPTEETGESQAAQIKQLCRQRPRAIISAAHRIYPAVFRVLESYLRDGGIVVNYDIPVPLDCDQVIFDREDNAYRATRHLLEQGHTRIGIGVSRVSERPSQTDIAPVLSRIDGYRRALAEFGIAERDDWFFPNFTYERGGAEMARRFLSMKDRPTALCIINDYVALAFMTELIRAGVRIPEDVSVIGMDNQPVAQYCPVPLTSTSQPAEAITEAVVQMLAERLEGVDEPPRTRVIRGELVIRQSVAPPP